MISSALKAQQIPSPSNPNYQKWQLINFSATLTLGHIIYLTDNH